MALFLKTLYFSILHFVHHKQKAVFEGENGFLSYPNADFRQQHFKFSLVGVNKRNTVFNNKSAHVLA